MFVCLSYNVRRSMFVCPIMRDLTAAQQESLLVIIIKLKPCLVVWKGEH